MPRRTFLLALILTCAVAFAVSGIDGADAGGLEQPATAPAAVVTAIQTTTDPGLLSTSNSIGYRVAEIERHFHSRERWFGKKAVQTATDWADNTLAPFRAISGLNAYGTEAGDTAQVIGTADTPVMAGGIRYDAHKLFVTGASSSTVYKIRLTYGSGTYAAAVAADQFSTVMVQLDAAASQVAHAPVEIQMPRGTCAATQVWVDVWNASDNATMDFFVGWHEYEG